MTTSVDKTSVQPDEHGGGPKRVWTTLLTNTDYLSGVLTLAHSLVRMQSRYPLVVLYPDEPECALPEAAHAALAAQGIARRRIRALRPREHKDYTFDPRFYDCWSKLAPFWLYGEDGYERVVQLDGDMLVVRNMDELMDDGWLPLDEAGMDGKGQRVFAAGHACVCNPLAKAHYPTDWIPSNCAFTTQHSDPVTAQTHGAPCTAGLAMPNGGLQVVVPSAGAAAAIAAVLDDPATTARLDFADQSLLAHAFAGRWVPLPYVYNALKTMRWPRVHGPIWRDDSVKNVHYILSPKPWEESEEERRREGRDELNEWWWKISRERLAEEKRVHGFVLDKV